MSVARSLWSVQTHMRVGSFGLLGAKLCHGYLMLLALCMVHRNTYFLVGWTYNPTTKELHHNDWTSDCLPSLSQRSQESVCDPSRAVSTTSWKSITSRVACMGAQNSSHRQHYSIFSSPFQRMVHEAIVNPYRVPCTCWYRNLPCSIDSAGTVHMRTRLRPAGNDVRPRY